MPHPTLLFAPSFTLALEEPGPLAPVRKSVAKFRGWVAAPGNHVIASVELQVGSDRFIAHLTKRGDVRRVHPTASTIGFETRIPTSKITAETVTIVVEIDGEAHEISTRVHMTKDAATRFLP